MSKKNGMHTFATAAAIITLGHFYHCRVDAVTVFPHVEASVGQIWPKPQTMHPGNGAFLLDPAHFQFKVS